MPGLIDTLVALSTTQFKVVLCPTEIELRVGLNSVMTGTPVEVELGSIEPCINE
jgi:hypothetical protein